MEYGILVLTPKGRNALKQSPAELTPLCRNILIQVDGRKSVEEILVMFRGLKGLEESVQRLVQTEYVQISRECKDLIKSLTQQMLGAKAPTLIKKIEEIHSKYGDTCWDHLDELDKTARLFYGSVVADNLKIEISKILHETKKIS